MVVTNPATYVSDSQTPSFESPVKHKTDGTFEFLISPDYEAGARELTYTVRYSDGTNSEKEESITITINDVTNMRSTFTQSVQNSINQPLSLIVMLIMLFMINTKLSLKMKYI